MTILTPSRASHEQAGTEIAQQGRSLDASRSWLRGINTRNHSYVASLCRGLILSRLELCFLNVAPNHCTLSINTFGREFTGSVEASVSLADQALALEILY